MAIQVTMVRTPRAPRLRLRFGVAALVVLGAVPGVMAQRSAGMVSVPSVQIGLTQAVR